MCPVFASIEFPGWVHSAILVQYKILALGNCGSGSSNVGNMIYHRSRLVELGETLYPWVGALGYTKQYKAEEAHR